MVQESALSTTNEPRTEVLPPGRLRTAGRVMAPNVHAAVEEVILACEHRKISRSLATELVKRLVPKRLPADISSLPERIETKAELAAALDELMRLRREGLIDNTEWAELQQAVERQFSLAQQAGVGR